MIGFFGTTPYHILLSMSMALNDFKGHDTCLVVFKRFKNSETIIEKLKEKKVFNKIVALDTHDFDKWKVWNRRYRMFFFYPEFQKLAKGNTFEEFIFFAPDFLEVSYMIKLLEKKSPLCKFSFGEDGIGTYLNENIYVPSDRGKKWLRLLNRMKYLNKIDNIYVKHPKLMFNQSRYSISSICSNMTEELKSMILFIWPHNFELDNGILFLQQPFFEDEKWELAKIQEDILGDLAFRFGKNVNVKLHPRTSHYDSTLPINYLPDRGLVESLFLKSPDIRTIVGINSTALFSSYLLWGTVTPIVSLINLTNDVALTKHMEKFLSAFEKEFKLAGGKIYIPKDYDDLYKIFEII